MKLDLQAAKDITPFSFVCPAAIIAETVPFGTPV
jgi:hypothetical protein